jgi:hypothetical protein
MCRYYISFCYGTLRMNIMEFITLNKLNCSEILNEIGKPQGKRMLENHRVQDSSGAQPASYPMGTRGSFPWGKASRGVKLTRNLHLVPRYKNAWNYTSTPQYAFMAWCSVIKGTGATLPFYLTFITAQIQRQF